jgi:hypothetical protein
MESKINEEKIMDNKKSLNSIRLSMEAYQKLNEMMDTISKSDVGSKITLSKILSFIVLEYFQKSFERSMEKIIFIHRDKKKDAASRIEKMTEEQLSSVIKLLEKMEKETPQVEVSA